MATPRTKLAPRTVGREDPEPRVESRTEDRAPIRDNVIRNRAGQPVSLKLTGDEDKFDLERMGIIPPPGWDYQWKRKSIKGFEDSQHQVELAQNGWEAVPASRHDGLCMPKGYEGNIERGGLILMERDMRLTVLARQIEKRTADRTVAESRQMAGLMPPSSIADFDHPGTRGKSGVSISRERTIGSSNYQYSVDEE